MTELLGDSVVALSDRALGYNRGDLLLYRHQRRRMSGCRIWSHQHKEIGEATHYGSIIRPRPPILIPVLGDTLATAADDLHVRKKLVGLEACC